MLFQPYETVPSIFLLMLSSKPKHNRQQAVDMG
jgi:hypothetical protein